MDELGVVALLERVSKSLPSAVGDVGSTQFRSPDLLLRSASRESAEGFALSDDGAVARALFGDERPASPPRSSTARSSPAALQPPADDLLAHLHRAACEGRPALLRFTYACVLGLLARGDLRVPAPLASRTRYLLLGALADLTPVASGLSARMAGSLVGLEALAGSGSGSGAQWDAACRARIDDAQKGGADGEDTDIRVLLASTMRAVAATPALRAPAVPSDISLPFSPEHESKLHTHTPADRAAHGAREALRDKVLGIVRSYRDIGSSFASATWPEFLQALPAAVAALRPLLLPSNAAWFARLLLGELELFHAHELLGGPAVASDARLLACDRSDGRLQQLAERLSGGGAAWGEQPPVGVGRAETLDAAVPDAAPAALRRLFESAAKGGGLDAGREPRQQQQPRPQLDHPRPPPPSGWGPGVAVASAAGPDLLQQRVQGSWSHGPPKVTGAAAPTANAAAPAVRSAPRVNVAASSAHLPAPHLDAQRPRSRREPLQDGSLRASAPASRGAGGSKDASAAAAAAARAEGQALSASIAVVDALRLRGACRFFVLFVLLLDNLHVTAALRLRVAAELRRSASSAAVFASLAERCERSLLPHAHRSRAHAQVLVAFDLAPLIVAAQSAFRSDAVAACDDFMGAPLSVDCAACLRAAAADECLAAVVPWVSQFVATAAYSVPVSLHGGLRDAHELLVRIAAEAQVRLLSQAKSAAKSPMGSSMQLVWRISPCAAVAIIATVEDLCSHPAIAEAGVHLRADAPQAPPSVARVSVAEAECTDEIGTRVDSSPALIGHRFLVETCPSLRPLHEVVRQRAAASKTSLAVGLLLAPQSPPSRVDTTAVEVFSTPSKSRPLLAPIDDLPAVACPAVGFLLSSPGCDSGDVTASSAPARTPAVHLPHVSFAVPTPLIAVGRQTSAQSARKIQPTLLFAPRALTDVAGAGGSGAVDAGCSVSIISSADTVLKPDVATTTAGPTTDAMMAGLGPLTVPGFRAELTERFFRLHPHLRRLVQAIAETAAVGAVRLVRTAAVSGEVSRPFQSASDAGGSDALKSTIAVPALRIAAEKATAAVRGLYAAADISPHLAAEASSAGSPAPNHRVISLPEEAELGVVLNLCVQEAQGRVLRLLQA